MVLKTSFFRTTDLSAGPKEIVRSARDLSLPDPGALLQRADVAGHLDSAMEAASEAVRGAIQQLPGQRRSRPWRPLLAAGLLVGVIAVVGVASWLVVRRKANASAERIIEDQAFDQAALDRAANEGMPVMTSPPDTRPHPNGEVRDLSAIAELA